ncbi:MAG: NADH:flavin oxidoreductase, partial [Ruminococcaceae bacterium]|nr:NADH:flavin oxidoreductase [Oscillospiraceae bacterium]
MAEKFTYKTKEALLEAANKAGVALPYSDDTSCLGERVKITDTNIEMHNSLTVHPMEGFDSLEDGSPSELTMRRVTRFAEGGAGLIWCEATAVTEDGRTNMGQLWINEDNLDSFKRMAEVMHEKSGGVPVIL